jgi:hypothetical protein
MKRSRNIRLILLGASIGALAGCSPGKPPISAETVYMNDDYVPGVGYYHAPFRNWYAFPYNYFDRDRRQFFYGGQWGPAPWESIVNLSSPSPEAATHAENIRTDIVRGGFGHFGGTGGGYYFGGG